MPILEKQPALLVNKYIDPLSFSLPDSPENITHITDITDIYGSVERK